MLGATPFLLPFTPWQLPSGSQHTVAGDAAVWQNRRVTFNRRRFLTLTAGGTFALAHPVRAAELPLKPRSPAPDDPALEATAARPVLQLKGLTEPVIIESIELLRKGREHFLRVRSKAGAEGIAVDDGRIELLAPILKQLIIPYFLGKDARELEEHLFGVYRPQSNYKLLGLALWCPVALVEFALLDLLGRLSGQSLGQMLGGVVRTSMPFYVASGRRDTTPEQEVDYLKGLIEQTGARAVKYRVGGRMSRNADALPGRTETPSPARRWATTWSSTATPTAPMTRPRPSALGGCWRTLAPSITKSRVPSTTLMRPGGSPTPWPYRLRWASRSPASGAFNG